MKITLISPASRVFSRWALAFKVARLSLGAVAAATPPSFDVEIVDENTRPIDFDAPTDLVGVTAMTALAPRAYEIADAFRARGVPAVLGGIHPTVLPNEALKHANAVVVGEAERAWPRLLSDFGSSSLGSVYKGGRDVPCTWHPSNRAECLHRRVSGIDSFFTVIQSSRGCPFNCDFCIVPIIYGSRVRTLPVEQVVASIKSSLHMLRGRIVLFFDDNIITNRSYARELFEALIPLKIRWASQGSVQMAQDTELLDLMYRSGCRLMFVGFESLCEENLASLTKATSAAQYADVIRVIQDCGIGVCGSFVYGFDHDDKSVFCRTVDFARDAKLEMASFSVLTPYPGTPLFEKLDAEGRIFDYNWANYTAGKVVFRPAKMTPEELMQGYTWSRLQFFGLPSLARRFRLTTPNLAVLPLNLCTLKASRQLAMG